MGLGRRLVGLCLGGGGVESGSEGVEGAETEEGEERGDGEEGGDGGEGVFEFMEGRELSEVAWSVLF